MNECAYAVIITVSFWVWSTLIFYWGYRTGITRSVGRYGRRKGDEL